jgi:hypothetical protein
VSDFCMVPAPLTATRRWRQGSFSGRGRATTGMWDALSLNRRFATSSADAEMAILATFLGLRAVTLLQIAVSLPTGLTQSLNPGLDALMVAAFVLETAGFALLALRSPSLRLPRLVWADVTLGCLFLLGQKLISSPDLMWTWNAWGYAATLSCAMAAGFGLRRRTHIVLAAAALTLCYLLSTVDLLGSISHLTTDATNSLSYLGLAGLARAISGYVRRLASDADEARRRAAFMGAQAEIERHRGLLHDQATVLSLLSRDVTDVRLQVALRAQAADGALRIAAFMTGTPDSRQTIGTLGAAVHAAVAQFPDLPLTCTVDLAGGLEVPPPVAEGVQRAVTTLLHNVRSHAGAATCVVHADADHASGWWEVLIRDDGIGFNLETTPSGYGLSQQVGAAMAQIGVQVTVRSIPDDGTIVTLTHPGLGCFSDSSPATPGEPGDRIAEKVCTR